MEKTKGKTYAPSVVAHLPKQTHPFSSIALSPSRQEALLACKDTLLYVQIQPLRILKTIPVAKYFISAPKFKEEDGKHSFVKDFYQQRSTPTGQPDASTNVVLQDVDWSNTHVAAAGSNGVIVVWEIDALLGKDMGRPEAILSQHLRSVHKLAFHPTKTFLLSASQDGTVLLWERRKTNQTLHQSKNRGFFFQKHPKVPVGGAFTWQSRNIFEPKSESIRDVKWSPHHMDTFALVTSSGSLVVYNLFVKARALAKLSQAHSGEATCLDWHPLLPNILATGGSDRHVKIWDLEQFLNLDETSMANASNNVNTQTSRGESVQTDTSSEHDRSSQHSITFNLVANQRTIASGSSLNLSRHNKHALHVLSITAAVTRVKWRPPSGDIDNGMDRHHCMLAIATQQLKGVGSGGSSFLGLWTYNRPFMPLSVMEGHNEGSVTDFDWLETPQPVVRRPRKPAEAAEHLRRGLSGTNLEGYSRDIADPNISQASIWQHTISVGRDGLCLIQSFVRGDRPMAKVPPSCFALANKSPFSEGYGSLQIFSVFQTKPKNRRHDLLLTGLRRDVVTARAPGMFREPTDETVNDDQDPSVDDDSSRVSPRIVFNFIDKGELDVHDRPKHSGQEGILIAPEVLHLSRLADGYTLYPYGENTTKLSICHWNANVAEDLGRKALCQMWKMIAALLESSGTDGFPEDHFHPSNLIQYSLFSTIKSLLDERANAGDVQTCVAICEVLQVLREDSTTRIPGLEVNLVREWYLTYIDLLRDMCLFSHATDLIRNCIDPYIGALNQQSTT